MPPRIARLAALGAFAAIGGIALLFALIFWVSAPPGRGGILPALSAVTWISLGVVFLALAGVHVLIGRQLLALSKGVPRDL
jgi:hypothetical protein